MLQQSGGVSPISPTEAPEVMRKLIYNPPRERPGQPHAYED